MNFVEQIRLYNLVNLLLIYKNLTSEFVRCLSNAPHLALKNGPQVSWLFRQTDQTFLF